MTLSRNHGFTLLETMIAAGLMSVLSLLMFTGVQASLESGRMANAETRVQNNIRDTLPDMVREVELGARATTAAGVAGLTGIRVFQNGVALADGIQGDMVVFQVPTDDSGANWSQPIQYRFINEDENNNGFLDDGEDDVNINNPAQDGNGDGMLTRCVVREQDLNGDGAFDDQGETRVIGGANEIQAVLFTMNLTGDVLTITVRSRQNLEARAAVVEVAEGGVVEERLQGQGLGAEATTQVYIFN